MKSNIMNLANELRGGALGKTVNKKKSKPKNQHRSNIKKLQKNKDKKSSNKNVFNIKKLDKNKNPNNKKELRDKDNKVKHQTNVKINSSLHNINKYLKPAYQIQDRSELNNHLHGYLIPPDLFTYYQINSKFDGVEILNKKSAILQILTHSHHKFNSNNQLLARTKVIHLQIPNYLNSTLNRLVRLIKHIKTSHIKYSSLDQLYSVMSSSKIGFNINKSTVMVLLIMGLLKPDNKLKKYLLNSVQDNVVKKLITTRYMTSLSTNKLKYTTVSLPSYIGVWLNIAEANIMKKSLNQFNFENNKVQFKDLENSLSAKYGVDGGYIFNLSQYLSSFTNLINFKLQYVLLTK